MNGGVAPYPGDPRKPATRVVMVPVFLKCQRQRAVVPLGPDDVSGWEMRPYDANRHFSGLCAAVS